jgi:hypothetical protein
MESVVETLEATTRKSLDQLTKVVLGAAFGLLCFSFLASLIVYLVSPAELREPGFPRFILRLVADLVALVSGIWVLRVVYNPLSGFMKPGFILNAFVALCSWIVSSLMGTLFFWLLTSAFSKTFTFNELLIDFAFRFSSYFLCLGFVLYATHLSHSQLAAQKNKNEFQLRERKFKDGIFSFLHSDVQGDLIASQILLERAKTGSPEYLDKGIEVIKGVLEEKLRPFSSVIEVNQHEKSLESQILWTLQNRGINDLISFDFQGIDNFGLLSPQRKQVALLVSLEAINNALKHGDPKSVKASIMYGESQTSITVANKHKSSRIVSRGIEKSLSKGRGIAFVRSKVEKSGGRVTIISNRRKYEITYIFTSE